MSFIKCKAEKIFLKIVRELFSVGHYMIRSTQLSVPKQARVSRVKTAFTQEALNG